jgi:hypothetical protein
MNTLKRDPQVVYISTLIYRLLLITYPKDFQREYASCMAQVFRDCCLRALHLSGFHGMLSMWSLALVDYIESVFEEYTHKGVRMNTLRFIRLSGWAVILGSAAFLTGMFAEVMISGHGLASDPNNFFSRPIDQLLAVLPYILIPSAMLAFAIGIIGIYIRYGLRAGFLSKFGLEMSIVGCGLSLVMGSISGGWDGLTTFIVGNQIGGDWLWNLAALGLFLLFSGIFIFGIDAVNRKLLSRWNFIPILVGVIFPVRILLGYAQEATTVGWSRWRVDISMINLPMLIITFLGLLALGYVLISDALPEEQLVMGNPSTIS